MSLADPSIYYEYWRGCRLCVVCCQAGMQAVRENRYVVLPKDFEKGYKNNIKKDEQEHEFYK